MPKGWAVDGDGPAGAARAGRSSALTPLGSTATNASYKGYGLAVMVEMLSRVLGGGSPVGHFLLALDPAALRRRVRGARAGARRRPPAHAAARPRPQRPRPRRPRAEAQEPSASAAGIPLTRSVLEDLRDGRAQRERPVHAVIRRAYGSWLDRPRAARPDKVPFLPREKLDRRRDERRRAAISATRASTSPTTQGLEDPTTCPVLDRDEVRAHPERFTAPGAKPACASRPAARPATPITVLHDRRSLLENIAYGERERAAVNALAGGFRPSELYVGYSTSNMHDISEYYLRETLMPMRPRRTFVDIDSRSRRSRSWRAELQPDLIVGYGGWIDLFFKTRRGRHQAARSSCRWARRSPTAGASTSRTRSASRSCSATTPSSR